MNDQSPSPEPVQDDIQQAIQQRTAQQNALAPILQNPVLQNSMKLVSNPAFTQLSQQVLNHPNRMNLLYCEIGWILFFIIFRAWRSSKLESHQWARRLFLSLWTMILFVAVASFAIPHFLIGDTYTQSLMMIYKSLTGP